MDVMLVLHHELAERRKPRVAWDLEGGFLMLALYLPVSHYLQASGVKGMGSEARLPGLVFL
jgi:hypothetical protein